VSRRLAVFVVAAGTFACLVLPAQADTKLAIPDARERAAKYAETTCEHDASCARAGVQSCRRHADRVILCRIFDHRKTEEQGNFICTRLVRLSQKPLSAQILVTGVSDWTC